MTPCTTTSLRTIILSIFLELGALSNTSVVSGVKKLVLKRFDTKSKQKKQALTILYDSGCLKVLLVLIFKKRKVLSLILSARNIFYEQTNN